MESRAAQLRALILRGDATDAELSRLGVSREEFERYVAMAGESMGVGGTQGIARPERTAPVPPRTLQGISPNPGGAYMGNRHGGPVKGYGLGGFVKDVAMMTPVGIIPKLAYDNFRKKKKPGVAADPADPAAAAAAPKSMKRGGKVSKKGGRKKCRGNGIARRTKGYKVV